MKILIDCDVLLDVLLEREPFFTDSAAILDFAEANPGSAAIAWHSVSNIYYIAAKLSGKDEARGFIGDLCGFLHVVQTGNPDVLNALAMPMSDFEDALQCAAALASSADCIVTRNIGDFEKSPIAVSSPEQFAKVHGIG
ncbi:MAG: PIN domain-containing protein [Desulfococcaceae bacterium]